MRRGRIYPGVKGSSAHPDMNHIHAFLNSSLHLDRNGGSIIVEDWSMSRPEVPYDV